jgi:CSLREA domain-containing protein
MKRKHLSWATVLAVIICVCGPLLASAQATFYVNTTNDTSDANPGDGVCSDPSGNCSLRAAIQEANTTVAPDIINFNITGIFSIDSTLNITNSLTIDGVQGTGATIGTLGPNNNGNDFDLKVFVVGQSVLTAINAIPQNGGGDLNIKGIALAGQYNALDVEGFDNVNLIGNFIGTDLAGNEVLGCRGDARMLNIGEVNIINNLINKSDFWIEETRNAAYIYNNYFGVRKDGLSIDSGDSGLTIFSRSGNTSLVNIEVYYNVMCRVAIRGGLLDVSGDFYNTQISYNYIGVDAFGGDIGNQAYHNISIGGDDSYTRCFRNLIANGGKVYSNASGIRLFSSLNHELIITENVIRNNVNGIWAEGSGNIEINDNEIFGNEYKGVYLNFSPNFTGTIYDNHVYDNLGHGIELYGASCDNINIVETDASTNFIHDNGGKGIYLGAGANQGIQPPMLTVTDMVHDTGNAHYPGIEGTYQGKPNTSYLIQLFSNTTLDACDAEGELLIYELDITTDGNGNASFLVPNNALLPLEDYFNITATATELSGNGTRLRTSEFSMACPTFPVDIFPENGTAIICPGDTISLTAIPRGGGGSYNYSWSGSNIVQDDGNVVFVAPDATSVYTVVLTDETNGCSVRVEQKITIQVASLPVVDAGGDQNACFADVATLAATATGGTPPYEYEWDNGLGVGANHDVTASGNAVYSVTVTDANGCYSKDAVQLSVNPSLAVDAGSDQSVAAGTTLTLNATAYGGASGYVYEWDNGLGVGANHNVTVNANSTYIVTVTDASNCMAMDTVHIVVSNALLVDAGDDVAVCNGGNATIQAVASGGTGGYSYVWDNGLGIGAVHTVFPFATTDYIVTVTDASGGTAVDTVRVRVNAPIAITGDDVQVCYGDWATLDVSASGGSGHYTYYWGSQLGYGATKEVLSSLGGSYTVTVTDELGCSATESVNLTVNSKLNIDIEDRYVLEPYTPATLTANVTGGDGNYTYLWSNNSTSASITVYPGQTTAYSVTVTDGLGCEEVGWGTVYVTHGLTVYIGSDQYLCGGQEVELTANVIGGQPDYVFEWSTGDVFTGTQTTSSITVTPNVTTTYSVTVTETMMGCKDVATIKLYVLPKPVVNAGTDQTVCQGESAVLNATGSSGVEPYSYLWNNGQSGSTTNATNLQANTQFIVTITDANGCSNTDTVMVNINPAPIVDLGPDIQICKGDTVNVTAAVSGGSGAGYIYQWDPNLGSASSYEIAPEVTSTYYIRVEDSNGCAGFDTLLVTVNENPIVVASVDADSVCYLGTAQLSALGSAGTSPYTYLWDDPNSSSGSPVVLNNLTSTATYTVTISDANGCKDTSSVTVMVNQALFLSVAASADSVCYNGSTLLVASASGGAGGYGYEWGDGTLGDSLFLSNLTATSQYSVTATDSWGCESDSTVNIMVNSSLAVIASAVDSTVCNGGTISLSASANGGSGGFVYAWSGPSGYEGSGASPVLAGAVESMSGLYIVTATDSWGCASIDTVNVMVNAPISLSASAADLTVCNGGTISLSASANGGSGGFVYVWSGPSGYVGSGASPILAGAVETMSGFYVVTATDSWGCTSIDTVNVMVNAPISLSASAADLTVCNGGTISLSASVFGGSGGFVYAWSGPSGYVGSGTSPSLAGADESMSGFYVVTATDSWGCTSIDSVQVAVGAALFANAGGDTEICYGNGAWLSGNLSSGGTGPLSFSWSNDYSGDSQYVTPSGTTTYMLTVTDSWGCVSSDDVTVVVNPLPTVTVGVSDADAIICYGDSIALTATQLSGTPGYTYSWVGPNNFTSTDQNPIITEATGNSTGNYALTLTDSKGCKAIDNVTISVTNELVAVGADHFICYGDSAILNPYGSYGGTVPYTYQWSGLFGTEPVVAPLETTDYQLVVTDFYGCTSIDTTTVEVNTPLSITLSAADTTVCNGETITLIASVSGGTASYNYTWSGPNGFSYVGQIAFVYGVTELSAGMYSVTVTDSKNCTTVDSILISVNASLSASASVSNPLVCHGGTINLGASASGGAASYNYVWSGPNSFSYNGQMTSIANAVVANAGWYKLSVTDSWGCVAVDSVLVSVNPEILVYANFDTEVCYGNGATISGSLSHGGTGSLSFLWSNGITAATQYVVPLQTTTYTLTVTDANNCSASDDVTIVVNRLPVVMANVVDADAVVCYGDTIALSSSVANGTPTYAYLWAGPASFSSVEANPVVPNATTANTGNYQVIVEDIKGCKDTANVQVTVNEALFAVANSSSQFICYADATVLNPYGTNGGTEPYAYQWDGLSGDTPEVAPLEAITYYLTATDYYGCIAMDSILINVNPQINATLYSARFGTIYGDTINMCQGGAPSIPLTLTVDGAGGTGNLSYLWHTGDVSQTVTFNISSSQTISVTITDESGCSIVRELYVNLIEKPDFSIQLEKDDPICQGDSISFYVTMPEGYNVGDYTIAWSNGVEGFFQTVAPTETTNYIVTVTDGNGCRGAETHVTIEVVNPIIDLGGDQHICMGESTTLNAIVEPNFNGAIQWSSDPLDNGLGGGASIVVAPTSTTTYFANYTDIHGCSRGGSATVFVGESLQVSTENVVACAGETLQITATVDNSNSENYIYTWSGGLGTGQVHELQLSAAGVYDYYVTVTSNESTCEGMGHVQVEVLPAFEASLTAVAPNVPLCVGGSTEMIFFFSGDQPPYSFEYEANGVPSGVIITNNNEYRLSVSPTENTTYTLLTANGQHGCSLNLPSSSSVLVEVLPLEVEQLDVQICAGGSYEFYGQTYAQPGVYADTIIGGGNNGCDKIVELHLAVLEAEELELSKTACEGTLLALNADDLVQMSNATYVWDNGTTDAVRELQPVVAGDYQVTVTGTNGCRSHGLFHVSVNPSPIANAGNDVAICLGSSVTLNASNSSGGTLPLSYQWQGLEEENPLVAPSETTDYYLTVIDANGCVATDTVVVMVRPLPNVLISGAGELCSGASTVLEAEVSGNAEPFTYTWNNGHDGPNQTVSPDSTTTYIVTVTDANQCAVATSTTISVLPSLSVQFATDGGIVSNDTLLVCSAASSGLNLLAMAAGGTGDFSYLWSTGGNTSSEMIDVVAGQVVSVTVTDAKNCSVVKSLHIEPKQGPQFSINFLNGGDNHLCKGEAVSVRAVVAANIPGQNIQWSNGGTGATQYLFPDVTTTYIVTVTDANNCASTTKEVTIYVSDNVLDLGADQYICKGETIVLTANINDPATNPNNILWDNGLGTGLTQTVSPVATTTYSASYIDSYGCPSEGSVAVHVSDKSLEVQTTDVIYACVGDTVQFTATVPSGNQGTYTYMWDGGLGQGQTQTLIVQGSATYNVTVTAPSGCTGTGVVYVLTNPQFETGLATTNNSICKGETTDLVFSFTSNAGNYTLVYTANGLIMPAVSVEGNQYQLNVQPTENTVYSVLSVESPNGCPANGNFPSVSISVLDALRDTTTVAICPGESYEFYGNVYDQEGWYEHTETPVDEGTCGHIKVLHLVVPELLDMALEATICQGEVYQLGNVSYSQTGIYNYNNNCDSIVTLDLTVLQRSDTTVHKQICAGDSFEGFDTTGVYLWQGDLQGANGCDSLVYLDLLVVDENSVYQVDTTICAGEVLELFGQTYTEAGSFNTQAIVDDCEMQVQINLSVIPYTEVEEVLTVCGSYTASNGQTYETSGIYNIGSVQGAHGCDSIRYMLDLTVLETSDTTVHKQICAGDSFEGFDTTGIYLWQEGLQGANGCDSLVYLDLFVVDENSVYQVDTTICAGEVLELFGQTYESAGAYTTQATIEGCQMQVEINLGYYYEQQLTEQTVTLCEGQSYGGFDEAGTYTQIVQGAHACDSIVNILTIFVIPRAVTSVDTMICEGSELWVGGELYGDQTGQFIDTLSVLASSGCDSLIMVNVTVLPLPHIVQVDVEPPASCADPTGSIVIQVGTPDGYLYSIDNGNTWQDNGEFDDLPSGDYVIWVKNPQTACAIEYGEIVHLEAPNELKAALEQTVSPSCPGSQDGAIQVAVTGGTPPYAYSAGWVEGTSNSGAAMGPLGAGVYGLTVTDGIGCQDTLLIALPDPEPRPIDLNWYGMESPTICKGYTATFDLSDQPFDSYEWTNDGGSFTANTPQVELTEAGTYYLTATYNGCESKDTITIAFGEEEKDFNFLLPSQGVLGDTIMAVDISWPIPDSIKWIFDTSGDITGLSPYLNQQPFVFHSLDTFPITMLAYDEGCVGAVEKKITIFENSGDLDFPIEGGTLEILEFELMPNPNDGNFSIKVKLDKPMDIMLRIYSDDAILWDTRQRGGAAEYTEQYNLTNLVPGGYVALLNTPSQWKMIKFVVAE